MFQKRKTLKKRKIENLPKVLELIPYDDIYCENQGNSIADDVGEHNYNNQEDNEDQDQEQEQKNEDYEYEEGLPSDGRIQDTLQVDSGEQEEEEEEDDDDDDDDDEDEEEEKFYDDDLLFDQTINQSIDDNKVYVIDVNEDYVIDDNEVYDIDYNIDINEDYDIDNDDDEEEEEEDDDNDNDDEEEEEEEVEDDDDEEDEEDEEEDYIEIQPTVNDSDIGFENMPCYTIDNLSQCPFNNILSKVGKHCKRKLTKLNQQELNPNPFYKDIHDVFSSNKLSWKSRESTLKVFQKYSPNQNYNYKDYYNSTKANIDSEALEINYCPKYCQVYLGRFENLDQCSICHNSRFKIQSTSILKQYNNSNNNNKTHNRIPMGRLYYQSLISLFIDLLSTTYFLPLIRFTNDDTNDHNKVSDILQTQHSKNHLNSMNQHYEDLLSRGIIPQNTIQVSLLLSKFYDSAKIYTHKKESISPLIISILNLPPNLRHILGIGSFQITMISSIQYDNAKSILLEKSYYAEAQILYKGVSFTLYGKNYFLQVRQILIKADTIGFQEEVGAVPVAKSLNGCTLCQSGEGTYRKIAQKVTYSGIRRLLPLNHPLRYYAQINSSPQVGYYNEKISLYHILKYKYDHNQFIPQESSIRYSLFSKEQNKSAFLNSKRILDNMTSIESLFLINIRRQLFYKNPNQVNIHTPLMAHPNIHFSQLDTCLWYPFLEPSKISSLQRVSMDTYRKCVQLSKCIDRSVDGINHASYFSLLPYADFEKDISFDFFHYAKNFFTIITGLITGDLGTNNNSFLSYYPGLTKSSTTFTSFWYLKSNEIHKLQVLLDCACMPSCTFHDLPKFSHFFTNYSMVKGIDLLKGYLIMGPFISFYGNFPGPIKLIILMISEDFSQFLNPEIKIDDINSLMLKAVELTALIEGVSPPTCMNFIFHQLFHIIQSIPDLGTIQNFMTLDGERNLGKITDLLKKGGTNPFHTMFKKTLEGEYNTMNIFYEENNLDDYFPYLYTENIPNETEKMYHYSQQRICLQNTKDRIQIHLPQMDPMRWEELFDVFYHFILQYYQLSHSLAMQKSGFYRIYFLFHQDQIKERINTLYPNHKISYLSQFIYLLTNFPKDELFVYNRNFSLSQFQQYYKNLHEYQVEENNYNVDDNDVKYKFHEVDVQHLLSFLNLFQLQPYPRAWIYGNHYRSLFVNYSCFEHEGLYFTENEQWISTHIHDQKFINAWNSFQDIIHSNALSYCQSLYFFRINHYESENLLNGLPFGRGIVYSFYNPNNENLLLHRIYCNSLPNEQRVCKYFPLTSVNSSSFLYIPFDEENKPISKPNYIFDPLILNPHDHLSRENNCHYIELRPLKPERNKSFYQQNLLFSHYQNLTFDSTPLDVIYD